MSSEEKKIAPASPDILSGPPKGAPGVERMNKKPLVIGGAALALVGLVMVYTLNERSAKADAPETVAESGGGRGRSGDANASATPTILADAPEGGIVPSESGYGALPALSQGQEAAFVQTGGVPPPPQLVQQNPVGPPSNRHAAAWEAYYQARQAQAQQRYERASSALGSASAIDVQQRQSRPVGQPPAGPVVGPSAGGGMQPAPGGPARRESGGSDLNRQDDKRAFLETSGGRNPYAAGRVESPVSPNEIKAGTVIPAVLTGGVNSDLPGQITAQVSRNVFDTATGRRLLIPQGARLVGVYDSSVSTGQSRVLVAWNRLIYPDGSSIDLGSMPAADAAGYAGLSDRVNNHYVRTFGSALFLSVFSAGVQLSQPQATNGENESASQVMAAQLGQQTGQLGMEVARRNMQIQPTLMLRPGLNMNVQVTQDLVLREWRPRR